MEPRIDANKYLDLYSIYREKTEIATISNISVQELPLPLIFPPYLWKYFVIQELLQEVPSFIILLGFETDLLITVQTQTHLSSRSMWHV